MEESETGSKTTPIKGQVIELQINNFSKKCEELDVEKSISTPLLTVFGIVDCFLEFYPKGSFWCTKPGHCTVFFGCPTNVEVELAMYAGTCTLTPKELLTGESTDHKVFGLHDFCELSQVIDSELDTVVVGVEIHSVKFKDEAEKESDQVCRITIE
eukprot:Platyproteum_vivax@DN4525_c0_g1_i2.p1